MIAVLLLALATAYGAWTLACLENNVSKARALKVPFVRIPFDVNNNLWVLGQPWVWKLLAYIPVPWASYPDFIRFSHRNWHFLEKSAPSARFGPIWALVSPGGMHIHVSDPDAIDDIFSRWRDFVRPVWKYQMIAIFGPSVFNVEMDRWPSHRKVVASSFNDSMFKYVWEESLRQSRAMVRYWASQPHAIIPDRHEDLRTLSLNVLAASAFKKSYGFTGSADRKDLPRRIETYRDALHVVSENILYLLLIPYHVLASPIMPERLANIGRAAISFRDIMMDGITEEKQALSRGISGSGGFITSLVRALDLETAEWLDTKDSVRGSKKPRGLTDDEVLGNVFAMNLAGHDTTANTLGFALMLLSASPETQRWLHEEIVTVTPNDPGQDWGYELFSRLKRCQAVILETLRLYAPITGLPKVTYRTAQTLRVGDRSFTIPPGVETFPMLLGAQTDPNHWVDPCIWRPSRWISRDETIATIDKEELLVPRKGTFFPWAEGPQGCPGKKFSQVEAVAVLAHLFRDHQVRPKMEVGDTEGDAMARARACVEDVNYQFLLRMNNPERVKLEFVANDREDA